MCIHTPLFTIHNVSTHKWILVVSRSNKCDRITRVITRDINRYNYDTYES